MCEECNGTGYIDNTHCYECVEYNICPRCEGDMVSHPIQMRRPIYKVAGNKYLYDYDNKLGLQCISECGMPILYV